MKTHYLKYVCNRFSLNVLFLPVEQINVFLYSPVLNVRICKMIMQVVYGNFFIYIRKRKSLMSQEIKIKGTSTHLL